MSWIQTCFSGQSTRSATPGGWSFAVCASGSVAADAQHKFFRLQLSTAAYTDPHIQHMSAISLGDGDVIVAISQSGQTRALLESVRLAREAGATVIGLAPKHPPSKASSISITVNIEEDLRAATPVSSRLLI